MRHIPVAAIVDAAEALVALALEVTSAAVIKNQPDWAKTPLLVGVLPTRFTV